MFKNQCAKAYPTCPVFQKKLLILIYKNPKKQQNVRLKSEEQAYLNVFQFHAICTVLLYVIQYFLLFMKTSETLYSHHDIM